MILTIVVDSCLIYVLPPLPLMVQQTGVVMLNPTKHDNIEAISASLHPQFVPYPRKWYSIFLFDKIYFLLFQNIGYSSYPYDRKFEVSGVSN